MLWIFSAIFANFFFAISVFIDRLILVGPLKNPHLYAFYTGILSIFVFLLIPAGLIFPLGLSVPPPEDILLGILAGFFSILALFAWFLFVAKEEASRAAPAVGALQPIFVLLLTILLLGERAHFSFGELSAFGFFVLGSIMIMGERSFNPLKTARWPLLLASTFLFAFSIVLTKAIFLAENFFTSVILIASGATLAALFLLFFPETRQGLLKREKRGKGGGKFLAPFLIGRASGAVGAGGMLFAIFLAKPAQVPIVNAMIGVQFLFLYGLVMLFSRRFPRILKEKMTGRAIIQKGAALALIVIGFIFLIFTQS